MLRPLACAKDDCSNRKLSKGYTSYNFSATWQNKNPKVLSLSLKKESERKPAIDMFPYVTADIDMFPS